MPSIAASMEFESPEKIKKSSTKMMEVDSNSVEKKVKKSSKKSKDKETAASAELEVVKKEKKRKVFDDEDEEEEEVEVNLKKKVKLDAEAEEEEEVEEEEDPNAVKNFRISSPLKAALKAKGIEALFPIQAMTFNNVFDGHDLVGRARTGQGKTLAFVLPILESLVNGPSSANRRSGYGRPPCVLVLLPTRELAQQVAADFEYYGNSLGLKACCLYGNSPMQQQTATLKRGIDIVIGTPGRVKDHVERGNLDFSVLKFRVLDEADEMLRMGFVEDVEFILGKVQDVTKVQTLLFSATLPDWVKKIQERFLKKDKKTVDLVGQSKMKASTNVRHLVMPCSSSARPQLIPDIIRCYSSGGRTIIFTETKESASTLAGVLHEARALHGDIQQSTREVTLKGFKSGRFQTLVATNVAARGLDIDDVQLIIQCEPPRDVEAYIHRSGRTGRAGKSGVAVMLYDPKKSNFFRIEKESGVKFERVSAPQPSDIAKAAGLEAVEKITEASDDVIPVFKEAAEELLNSSGLSAVEILSKALATAAGYTEIKTRSLLSSMENHVTVLLECGRPIYSQSFAYGVLRRFIPEEKVESIKGFALTADGNGAVFDVATSDLDSFLIGQENAAGVSLEVVKSLPALQAKEPRAKWGFGGGGGGRGFSNGRGGGGRGGGGGYNNNRFSSFGGRGRGGNNRKW